jgi:DHA2 family multidrug resistance protein
MADQPADIRSTWKPSFNPYLVALTVTLATFMEVLDSSIANVSLPHIGGSLGSTYEESTWVLTSYLVSAAIVLPVSGWLSNLMGRKRFYMTCVLLFTISSFLCGISQSLPMLIVARILQGAGGGGLQPSEQAILADTFSIERRGMAFALYGMAVVVAPAIGPTLGGWITDNFNWHWIFFINLPVGVLSLFLADWFSSRLVLTCTCIGIPTLIAFFIWEWYHDHPIVDVRLLKNRNFGTAVFFSFILGMTLFGSTVLIPEFLQSSLGYTAERAGMALSPAGFLLMAMMPVAGRLTSSKIDPRLLIAIGFLGTAFTLNRMTILNLQIDFRTIVLLRMAQVIFIPLIFVPISTLNYVGVPREKNNQVAGLSNFARNMGGSIGTSLLTTFLARQNQTQQVNFASHTTYGSRNFEQMLSGMTAMFVSQGYDAATAAHKALAMAYLTVQRQASAVGIDNAFWMMSLIIVCLVPLPFIMRRPKPGQSRMAAH